MKHIFAAFIPKNLIMQKKRLFNPFEIHCVVTALTYKVKNKYKYKGRREKKFVFPVKLM